MIQIIESKEEWSLLVHEAKISDFYHTYDYHHLSKNTNETPLLLHYSQGSNRILLPLLIREIEGTNLRDASSVYGYAGPLVVHMDESFDSTGFNSELIQFLKDHGIISVFSRLHPFIPEQAYILEGLGQTLVHGKVVYVDLRQELDVQRAKFNRRLKTYLNKSRKICTVIEGNVKEHLDDFIHLYHENMRRVNADEGYFFDKKYFYDLLTSDQIDTTLLLCKHNESDTITGGAIFVKSGPIVQYHLSGLSENHFELNPIKLIIDEMRIKATEAGYTYLNLGGGRGGAEDSLYAFKSGFSKDNGLFSLWKFVVDDDAYRKLTIEKLGEEGYASAQHSGFFPAYRSKIEASVG